MILRGSQLLFYFIEIYARTSTKYIYLWLPGTIMMLCANYINIVTSDLQECYDFCEKLSEEHLRDLTETLFVPTSNQHLLKKVGF